MEYRIKKYFNELDENGYIEIHTREGSFLITCDDDMEITDNSIVIDGITQGGKVIDIVPKAKIDYITIRKRDAD